MLTETQKEQIAAIAAARDAANAAAEEASHADAARVRAENLTYWQPVLAAAARMIPEFLQPVTLTPDARHPNSLEDEWVIRLKNGGTPTGACARVTVTDASATRILTLVVQCNSDGSWSPARNEYPYEVITTDRYRPAVRLEGLDNALIRLAEEDACRAEQAAAAQPETYAEIEAREKEEYARMRAEDDARAHEIAKERAAAQERREQFETELAELMTAAGNCMISAKETIHARRAPYNEQENHNAVMHALQFSQALSFAAIARMLDDWRKTARQYAENQF